MTKADHDDLDICPRPWLWSGGRRRLHIDVGHVDITYVY